MKKIFFILIILLIPFISVPASDWGLLLNQNAGIIANGKEADNSQYSAALVPWFDISKAWGKIFISLGPVLSVENKEPSFAPDIYRTELMFNIKQNSMLKIGRMPYSDPLGYVAQGLFDGAQFAHNIKGGTLGFGIWYTGVLYNKSARITITDDDYVSYAGILDYKNFIATYFASRRLVFAADWDNKDISDWITFRLAFIGQFDLNGQPKYYHSQYLAVKASVPINKFIFDLGFCPELAETPDGTKFAAAWEMGLGFIPPTPFKDWINLTGRFTSGAIDKDSDVAQFQPITTLEQGDVLKAKLSGLSMIRLNYIVRSLPSLSLNFASSYFVLSDKASYMGLPAGRNGHFLGNEFSAKVLWVPLSDLRLSFVAGVFLPSLGNADPKGKSLWRFDLTATIIIF